MLLFKNKIASSLSTTWKFNVVINVRKNYSTDLCLTFQVLKAASMKFIVWDVVSCSHVEVDRC
jgi:hypothetical protein